MIKEIPFTATSTFLGRNGEFSTRGLRAYTFRDRVTIYPVTKRYGKDARCYIEIPMAEVPQLIAKLSEILLRIEDRELPTDVVG